MTLPDSAIIEFKELYKAELGVDISYKEASERAVKFLRMFKKIYQPIPIDWVKNKIDI